MTLKHELVLDAITKHRPLGKLFESAAGRLLDDYVVRDYVTNENIPEINLNGVQAKCPASSFFKGHQYLMPIDIQELLQHFDSQLVGEYHAQKRFPLEYTIHFFDTFIVAEIMPRSLRTEFVVVSPPNQGGDEILGGLMASTAVTALFSAISQDPGAQLALYVKLDELLEYFRTGLGKKKRFGIF
jgi:hypothetical protein